MTLEGAAYAGFFWALVVLTVIDLDFKLLPDKVTLPLFVTGAAVLALASAEAGTAGHWAPPGLLGAGLALVVGGLSWEWPPWKVFSRPVSITDEERPEAVVPPEDATHPGGVAPSEEAAPLSDAVFLAIGVSGALLWIVLIALAFIEGDTTGLPGAAVGAAMFAGLLFVMNMFVPRGIGMGDAKLALSLGLFLGYLAAPKLVLVAMFMSFLLGGVGGILLLLAGAGRKDQVPFGPYLVAGTILAIFAGDRLADIYLGSL
ncbi:MAG TPA: A24 family peptidase [Actinomycetota bacterium]|nr:A24 family peptidase [Actinomycetota bacterium]